MQPLCANTTLARRTIGPPSPPRRPMCVHFLCLGSALACANQSSFCGLALVSQKGVPGSLATENATPPSTSEPTGRNWARWVPFHHVSSSGTEFIRHSFHVSNRSVPSLASLLLAHRSLTQPLLSPSCGFTLASLNTLITHRASFVPGSSMENAGCYPKFYSRRYALNTSPTPWCSLFLTCSLLSRQFHAR